MLKIIIKMKKILLIISIFTLSLACSDDEKAVPDLTVNPSILEFDSAESVQKVYVGSNTSWTTSSDTEWCRASITQKFGNDTVEIRVEANTGDDERIAYISINNQGKTIIRTVKIIQESPEISNPEDI
jgi:hypothetical protein